MLPLILYIETSEQICSVCLAEGENIIAAKANETANSHASALALFVQEILKENKITVNHLNAVAISAGPGSYTGLRIGVSLAKGICYAGNIPLIAVATLKAMAFGVMTAEKISASLYCPMTDARRMEVYTAVYDNKLNTIIPEQPIILSEESIKIFDFNNTVFFGSGANKILQLNPDAFVFNSFKLKATHLVHQGMASFSKNDFVDLAYFEPNYIKPFYSPAKISGDK